jgi:hypothetical protein
MNPFVAGILIVASFLVAFAAGFAIQGRTIARRLFAGLVVAALVGGAVVYAVDRHHGACPNECEGRAAKLLVTVLAIAAWLLGLALGALVRQSLSREPLERSNASEHPDL